MYKTIAYATLFLTVVLLQIFLFDNLSISIFINPLVYITFVAMMPLDTKPIVMLLTALLLGVVMDWTMGAAGINTIATLFVGFFRSSLLTLICGREDERDTGCPSPERMGMRSFAEYLTIIVVVHHSIFFVLEALSTVHLWATLLRIVLSSALTVGAAWLIMRIFTAKIPVRV